MQAGRKSGTWAAALLTALMAMAGCGGSGIIGQSGQGSSGTGTVTVTLSDPATCGAPNGPYTHIWLTVADVEASSNANAPPGDASFVDLTPQLKTAPMQVDLLAGVSQCQLPALAGNTPVAAGQYAQLRVFPAADAQAGQITGNHCGAASNCVQLASNGSIQPIVLSTEATDGLPIAAAALLGGPFSVTRGQSQRVNIAFDACASLLVANGQITLNSVVTGGAVSAPAGQVSGTLANGISHGPIGGRQVVALEQPNGMADQVVMETAADSTTGAFQFCAVPAGSYDLVAVAASATGGQYSPTLLTAVPSGAQLGTVAVYPGVGVNANPGTVRLTINSGTAMVAIRVAAQERIAFGAQTFTATIPIPQEPAATVTTQTAPGSSCGAGSCANLLVAMPALTASFGSFQGTPNTFISANTTVPAIYQFSAESACILAIQTTGDVSVSPNGSASPPPLDINCP